MELEGCLLKAEPKYMKLYRDFTVKYADAINFVRKYYEKTAPKDRFSSYPWSLPEFKIEHVLRVLRYCMMLAVRRKVDLDVIALSAILHDLAVYTSRKQHAIEGSKVAEKYLKEKKYPEEFVKKVVRAIAVHSGPLAFEAETMEERILQDADTIDKVGALGITVHLLHCGCMEHMPKEALSKLKERILPRLEFYRKTMHTPEGKKIVSKGCKYVRTFIERLEREL